MNPSWDRIQNLFLEALDLRAEERAQFLDSACAGDPELRCEVESLIAHDGTSDQEITDALHDTAQSLFDSEDLTAQYYDLEAHIKNRMAARDTLRELLKEAGKKEMKHYLEIWDKLEQITDEINRKEGQLRLWANLTDLTTVTVHLHEKQRYIAGKKVDPAEVPTFGMRAGKTWHDSWEALVEFGQAIAIGAIALTPWLPVPLVLAFFLWLTLRFLARKRLAPVVVEVVEQVPEKKA